MHRQLDTRMVATLRCRCASPSMLSYLATALPHLKADDYRHMRHMRIKLPKASERKPEPVTDVDPRIVAVLLLHEFNELQRAA